jgi:WD40 repeat protein
VWVTSANSVAATFKNVMPNKTKALRIFISSPGDVVEERELAKQVVQSLRKRYAGYFSLKPVLWEDLPLTASMSFQEGIDMVLSEEQGIDVALFILWSRMGTPLGTAILKEDGSEYLSGTEREWDMMNRAVRQSLAQGHGEKPHIIVYQRRNDVSFHERMRGLKTEECQKLLVQKERVEAFMQKELHDPATGANTRAYHSYDRPIAFSDLLRRHLTELLDRQVGEGGAAPVWDIGEKGPPFLGLEAFQPCHADVFFGRERETLQARHALREQARRGCAFLLLSGASGSGKSSLARAGVLPAIMENEVDEQVAAWRSLIATPLELGSDPLAGLMHRLTAVDVLPELSGANDDVSGLIQGMRKDPALTVDLRVNDAFTRAAARKGGGVRVLLVVDQLEELFATAEISEDARKAFLAALEALARSGHVWVLATVRSDFSGQVQTQPALVRMTEGRGLLPVLQPETDSLRRLIEEPARLAGLSFEERDGQNLADRILHDAASHAELLPLLEYVLRELYEQRTDQGSLTFEVYERLGGVEGALAKRAEDVFRKLPADAREEYAGLLKALVTIGQEGQEGGGDQVVRQRVPLANLTNRKGRETLVRAFVEERLLTTNVDPVSGQAIVTVAHESLLRVWPRAQAWAGNNRDFLHTRARIAARMREGSPLLEGDPLMEAARSHLASDEEGFEPAQRSFIVTSVHDAKSARRRREWLRYGAIAAVALVILISTVLYFLMQREVERQRERDAMGRQLASESERELARKDFARAEVAAAKSLGFADTTSTRNLLLAAQSGGIRFVSGAPLTLPEAGLSVFSRDGRLVASVISPPGEGRGASVVILADEREKWRIDLAAAAGMPECMAFDGSVGATRWLAIAGEDHLVNLWRLDEGAPAVLARQLLSADGSDSGKHIKRVPSMVFHPSRPWLATSSEDQKLCLWDYSRSPAQLIWEQREAHDTAVHGIAFNGGGDLLASGGGDYRVKIWPTAAITAGYDESPGYRDHQIDQPLVLKGHTDSVFAVAFSPDGSRLASAGYDRIIRVWDLTLRKQLPRPEGAEVGSPEPYTHPTVGTLYGHEGTVLDLVFSDDSKLLTSGAKDETVRLWDVSEGRLLATLTPSSGVIRSIACRGFDRNLYCGGEDGWSVWSAAGRTSSARLWNGGATVQAIAFDPTGEFVATGGNDGRVRIWDTKYRSTSLDSSLAGESLNGIAFSSDGKWLAAGGEGKVIHLWQRNGEGWAKVSPPNAISHEGAVWGLCFDPQGRWLVSGNTDKNKRIKLWRLGDWKLLRESEPLNDSVYTLTFDPQGRFLIRGDSMGKVEVRKSDTLEVVGETINVRQGEANVWSVAVCPDPLSILSGNSDGKVYRWVPGLPTWRPGSVEEKISISDSDAALNHTINSVSYSQKHRWVAAGGDGGSVQIYDANLKLVRSLLPTDGSIWFVAFDPRGSRLAYGGTDRILRIINIDETRRLESESPDVLFSEAQQMTGLTVVDGRVVPQHKAAAVGQRH